MTLSISKLEKLLLSKSMIIKKIYTIGNLCVYIEVMNMNNTETIMIYIPSKYEINAGNGDNLYKIHFLQINDDGTIPTDYAEVPNDIDIGDNYQEVDINTIEKDNIEKHLEESYNCPVSLKDIGKEDINELKDIFRQLRRLRFCVQSLKYKLCIFYKFYMCCIRRDDTYECYSVENFNTNNNRKLVVTIDLETLYEKINTVETDSKSVYKGVFYVLNKNQNKHIRNLQKMLEYTTNFDLLSIDITNQKNKYQTYLEKLETMLTNLLTAEKDIIENIITIKEKYLNKKDLHHDIEKSHLISKKEDEITNINYIKQDVIRNILKVKMNMENLSLKVDQICFDNTVMLDTIIKNFDKLSQI